MRGWGMVVAVLVGLTALGAVPGSNASGGTAGRSFGKLWVHEVVRQKDGSFVTGTALALHKGRLYLDGGAAVPGDRRRRERFTARPRGFARARGHPDRWQREDLRLLRPVSRQRGCGAGMIRTWLDAAGEVDANQRRYLDLQTVIR